MLKVEVTDECAEELMRAQLAADIRICRSAIKYCRNQKKQGTISALGKVELKSQKKVLKALLVIYDYYGGNN